MITYQKLFDYIDYFKTISEDEVCRWEGGKKRENDNFSLGYPVYNQKFKNFIDDVYETEIMDANYIETLERYQLAMSDELRGVIDSANLQLTRAILTVYVRQERFSDGLWATAVKDKVFYKILLRLKKISDDRLSG
ncbi:hypothetical protein GH741_17775 [Aquibacillus halophilus]|uniref:Uncharacterized protein n=1 Tax=Aquibacillus halophilus TaxID=930132 RepID=A0A6A8DN80_9BACI|nr:DUF6508 domain-containing protein [Aquibacillus halophilus]MRH44497.1 hypothetical protein [Aquibacillus halophilus]